MAKGGNGGGKGGIRNMTAGVEEVFRDKRRNEKGPMRLTGCKQGELNVLAGPFLAVSLFFGESGACTNTLSLTGVGTSSFAALVKASKK
jgi:hypothetical protein